jgi:uncharacterized Fe-S cluster-containing radical SAM superfamily protein
MPQPVVLVRHPEHGWLLINRSLHEIVNLTPEEAESLHEDEVVRRSVSRRFVAASYEITELCNVHCVHCYLSDVRQRSPLNIDDQLALIDQIESTGAIWLQISGGEPLTAPTFVDVYHHAWDRGFLITVLTNGTLLSQKRFLSLFQERPPFRISVSVYGATKETYERVTSRSGSWEPFQAGILAARTANLKLRLKVIELTDNTHELDQMLDLARISDEYDHVREIIPTLGGKAFPTQHQVQGTSEDSCWSGCDAGTTSFHVRADGFACLCKISREPSVPLTEVESLVQLSEKVLARPTECLACTRTSTCHVCPALYRLLAGSNGVQHCAQKER